MTENYTATLEITPELEEWARTWADEHIENMRGTHAFCDIAKAILDAKSTRTLLEQAYQIVHPKAGKGPWRIPTWAISAMSGWIAEHHNGRLHGYPLQESGWTSWLMSDKADYQIETFDTQQEAMAWLVVEMHRKDTDA